MTAECTRTKPMFHGLEGRQVFGRFDGGEITSDAGGVLLREVEQRTRILGRLSQRFTDYRDPNRIEHLVEGLIKQRVLGLCLGYEDLNDHDELCHRWKVAPTKRAFAFAIRSSEVTLFLREEASPPTSAVAGSSRPYTCSRVGA